MSCGQQYFDDLEDEYFELCKLHNCKPVYKRSQQLDVHSEHFKNLRSRHVSLSKKNV